MAAMEAATLLATTMDATWGVAKAAGGAGHEHSNPDTRHTCAKAEWHVVVRAESDSQLEAAELGNTLHALPAATTGARGGWRCRW